MSMDRPTEYLGSHTGYSWLGQAITCGSVPWAVLAGTHLPVTDPGLAGWAWYSLLFPPLIVWFIGKVAGPDRLAWFYRHPSRCTFSANGVQWHSEMPFAQQRDANIAWADIVSVNRGYVHTTVVGHSRSIAVRVPADVTRLQPIDAGEDWSFAQALVAYRPEAYVVTDPVVDGQSSGARQREPHEPASEITPLPLSRARPVRMAFFMATIFGVGLIRAFLRN